MAAAVTEQHGVKYSEMAWFFLGLDYIPGGTSPICLQMGIKGKNRSRCQWVFFFSFLSSLVGRRIPDVSSALHGDLTSGLRLLNQH